MKEIILNKENIVIISHKNPDGDAIGSSLAIQSYIAKLGKKSIIILPDDFPDYYQWMKGSQEVLIAVKNNRKALEIIDAADLIFCLDFNDLKRVGDLGDAINKSSAYKVMIDHHQNPSGFADFTLSRTECCSTAQLIYEFIDANGDVDLIDQTIAEGIYTGIITDSGSFKYSNVESKTHKIAANLIEKGLNHTKIHENIFDQNNIRRLHLLGYALSKIQVIENIPVAFIALSKEDLKKFYVSKGATEGLVNYCLSLKGIKVAALIREDNGLIKMSFRSKGTIKVNDFARNYFDGGGHLNAAGGKSELKFEAALNKFKENITEFIS